MMGGKWNRSWAFPDMYTMDEAQGLIDSTPGFAFRITPLRKSYRRHTAVSQLELRGAKTMLESTREYMCREYTYEECKDAWQILYDARLTVIRQLETL